MRFTAVATKSNGKHSSFLKQPHLYENVNSLGAGLAGYAPGYLALPSKFQESSLDIPVLKAGAPSDRTSNNQKYQFREGVGLVFPINELEIQMKGRKNNRSGGQIAGTGT